nr:dual specificity protein phosphatase 10-like [Paramormyrops kingsleyae]
MKGGGERRSAGYAGAAGRGGGGSGGGALTLGWRVPTGPADPDFEEAHQRGRGVLVHCQAGVSRSATIVIAYLMKHTRMTMMDAYKYVRGRRPVVSPNLNFMGQLLEFERDLNSGITPRILTPKLNGLETQHPPLSVAVLDAVVLL